MSYREGRREVIIAESCSERAQLGKKSSSRNLAGSHVAAYCVGECFPEVANNFVSGKAGRDTEAHFKCADWRGRTSEKVGGHRTHSLIMGSHNIYMHTAQVRCALSRQEVKHSPQPPPPPRQLRIVLLLLVLQGVVEPGVVQRRRHVPDRNHLGLPDELVAKEEEDEDGDCEKGGEMRLGESWGGQGRGLTGDVGCYEGCCCGGGGLVWGGRRA